jgi:hypothetical protein
MKGGNNMKVLAAGCALALAALTLWVGVSAFVAFLVMKLFNYVAVQTHHQNVQITFWVAWAGMFLLGLIASPFRVTVTKSER